MELGGSVRHRLIVQNERRASGTSNPGRLAAISSTGVLQVFWLAVFAIVEGIFRSLSIGFKYGSSLPNSSSSHWPGFPGGRSSTSERQNVGDFDPSRT